MNPNVKFLIQIIRGGLFCFCLYFILQFFFNIEYLSFTCYVSTVYYIN